MNTSAYDDDKTINFAEEREYIKLVVDLLNYSKELEEMVIELRKEINRLTPAGHPLPYAELHSDVYVNFVDYPAYEKYKEYIELFFTY